MAEHNRDESSPDVQAKRAWQRRQNLIAGAVLGSLFGMAAVLLVVAALDTRQCYEVPPSQFFAQADLIKPGMTAGKVTALVRWATDTTTMSGGLVFAMRPNRVPIIPVARVMSINVHLGPDGKVVSVDTGDG